MSQFEKYHPILTPHYAFDWLTKARAIDVFRLYETTATTAIDMPTVAAAINQTMREIFRDQKLLWGVTTRVNDTFIGEVGFDPIDLTTKQATLRVNLFPANQQDKVLTEIMTRLVAFGTAELKLTDLTVTLPTNQPTFAKVLENLNFTTTDHHTYRYQK